MINYFLRIISGICISLLLLHKTEGKPQLGFSSEQQWIIRPRAADHGIQDIEFLVALELKNVENMREQFRAVSDPKSPRYGKYYDLGSLSKEFSLKPSDRELVAQFFSSIPGARVQGLDSLGDFLRVRASIKDVEEALSTRIEFFVPSNTKKSANRGSYRAVYDLSIPSNIEKFIAFTSLTAPILNLTPRLSKAESKLLSASTTVGVVQGNEEALVQFIAQCGDGTVNNMNPPCSTLSEGLQPQFVIKVTEQSSDISDTSDMITEPLTFDIDAANVYCYNSETKVPCDGSATGTCYCLAKLSPLPKYTQLRANITYTFEGGTLFGIHLAGTSSLFALTDTATAATLSYLYHIPSGLRARYGSNQSVAEFYGEFYSNSDLAAFLSFSGLPNASIPVSNVYGDLPNDQSSPGGEAQLDVEYIMALAPGADTFFYSFSDLNPYNSENEGFLTYLYYVGNQSYPPLVHSLSYGDVEANVFNASNPGSAAYGERCDQEFMKMGLRGLTVVFSSGDDGIGNNIVRDDPTYACSQAFPAWPASSPYVTTVGATQLSDQYLPVCFENYATSSSFPSDLPSSLQLPFQCTAAKETTCSSTIGGVITSGGGFSNVIDRAALAPWQDEAVAAYLSDPNNIPPLSYFNSSGRAYPDVATYGSNYFVYLGGSIVRESGTSASAPVFAAMVTLWNDMRLAYGYAPMGFIAPFLYDIAVSHPEAFNDITTGDNACGAGHSLDTVNCCEYSFKASPGWDAVTGLGSPNFQVISNLVLNASIPYPAISASSGLNSYSYVTEDSSDDNSDDYGDVAIAALVLSLYGTLVSTALLGLALYYIMNNKPAGLKEPFIDSSSRGLTQT